MRNLWLLFLVGLATGVISETLLASSPLSDAGDYLYVEGHTSGDLPIDDEDGEDNGSGSGSGDYAFSDIADKEEVLRRFLNFSKTTVSKETVQPQPTGDYPPTTVADSQDQTTTVETTPHIILHGDNGNEEVLRVGPTGDWFGSTIVPPSETTATEFSIDISVTKDANEDNSLDGSETSTFRDKGDVLIKEEIDNEIRARNQGRMYEMDSPEEVTSENLWERTDVLAAVIACGVVGFLCAVFLLLLLAYRMKKKDEGSYDLGDTKLSTTAYHKAPTKEFYA